MMFLDKVIITKRVDFEQTRLSQDKMFKIKSKKLLVDDRSKPIRDNNYSFGRIKGYKKKEIIENTFTIFRKGLEFNLKTLTVIVGENGSGKSTFLNFLKPPKIHGLGRFMDKYNNEEEYVKDQYIKWLTNEPRKLVFNKIPNNIFFDNNIHKVSRIDDIKNNGKETLSPQELLMLWDVQSFSNGETTIDMLNSIKDLKNTLILLDEPETSLSISNQIKISKLLKTLSENNQVIVVTHSPYIIDSVDEVLSFDTRRYIKSKTYINKQKKIGCNE